MHGLMAAMGNTDHSNSQRQADLTLEVHGAAGRRAGRARGHRGHAPYPPTAVAVASYSRWWRRTCARPWEELYKLFLVSGTKQWPCACCSSPSPTPWTPHTRSGWGRATEGTALLGLLHLAPFRSFPAHPVRLRALTAAYSSLCPANSKSRLCWHLARFPLLLHAPGNAENLYMNIDMAG